LYVAVDAVRFRAWGDVDEHECGSQRF